MSEALVDHPVKRVDVKFGEVVEGFELFLAELVKILGPQIVKRWNLHHKYFVILKLLIIKQIKK